MTHRSLIGQTLTLLAVVLCFQATLPEAVGATILRNICRVKGQEENVLRGVGLVVGLNGTGEVNDPTTMRALTRAMEIMGIPIPQTGLPGQGSLDEFKKIKNVALVWVTAHVPATGARRGDQLPCRVAAVNGKSLTGGHLAFAALQGPNTQDRSVYALCEGPIFLENPDQPLVGIIHSGCQMEEDVFTPFVQNGIVTLILDKNHANFQTATEIANHIGNIYARSGDQKVRAVNAAIIEIEIPGPYIADPVGFVSGVLEMQVYSPEPEARVVINERTGSIVISGSVTIGDVVVSTQSGVVVEAGEGSRFIAFDPERESSAKLRSLVDALNSLKVPNTDAIDIIKGIDRNGKLHGKLILE